jgi:uncharacterized protein (DUF111 family)
MSNISISSPFVRAFTHAVATVDDASISTILPAATTPERRVSVIIQNQDASSVITVILNATGSLGLYVKAGESISLDNYNGIIRCISTAPSTPVHIAYAVC